MTPSDLWLSLDWRNVPSDTPEQVHARLQALLGQSLLPGCQGKITTNMRDVVAYTGLHQTYPDLAHAFDLPAEHPWTVNARAALAAALERPVDVGLWTFATDGGLLMQAGIPTVGFGPGEQALAHSVQERLPLDQLIESVAGYLALALV